MDNWEFPAELDEFLEFCVEEHGGDFVAISREFLEVASGLDEQLASRAEEAFSAQSLQQRYMQLRGEPAATEVTETTELEVEDWKQEALGEEAPSQFSVLTDNLQDRVRRIYNNVQLRLPSAFARDEEDSEQLSEGERSEGSEEGLREAAVRLFGSSDLGHVVQGLSSEAPEPTVNKDPSGLIARALRGEEAESSEDSQEDDFRALRKQVKDSSKQLVDDPKKPRLRLRAPAPKPKTRPQPKPQPKAKATSFVRLELVESDDASELPEESGSETEADEADAHLRVLQRLERDCPTGDCPWDVWLAVTRAWPQLKAKLNMPDFVRKGNDLRVNFDVDLLKKVISEERLAREEAKAKRLEEEEHHEVLVKKYVAEAERRRELIKGRLGFLLAPRSEKLEMKDKELKVKEMKFKEAKEREMKEAMEKEAKVQEEKLKEQKLLKAQPERCVKA